MGLTADVTGQQDMLTPPRHVIPALVFQGVRVNPIKLIATVDSSIYLRSVRIRVRIDNPYPLATKWGGPSDETGKIEAPCHDKDPSLLKGSEA
jgi:hypothetical protein